MPGTQPNQAPTELLITRTYPFPIAYLFQEMVLNEEDPEKKVRGIAVTFENSLRYLAMLFLGEYNRYPGRDNTVNALIDRLDRPSMGDFFALLDRGTERLSRSHDWIVQELPPLVKSVRGARGLPASSGKRQALMESLLSLRNRLAHREYRPQWRELVSDYYPLLIDFLSRLEFLAHYPLCRVASEDTEGFSFIELMGKRPEFIEQRLPGLVPPPMTEKSLFVVSRRDNLFLSLHPFAVMRPCPACQPDPVLPGVTDEVFLLNGADEETTVFIGVRHYLSIQNEGFAEAKARKKAPLVGMFPQDVTTEELFQRAENITSRYRLTQAHSGVYLPSAYVTRPEIDQELKAFISNKKTAFLLLGETGIGKTTLLVHLAEQLSSASFPTLYYPAADLQVSDIDTQLLAELGLLGSLGGVLTEVELRGSLPLILIFDGLNEHPQPSQALAALHEFIARYAGLPLKVVLSVRTSHFPQILSNVVDTRRDPEGAAYFSRAVYHTSHREEVGGVRETVQNLLTRLDRNSAQLEEAYEKYRSLEALAGHSPAMLFRPLSPFSELSGQVRTLICNPWLMRLVTGTYHGRTVPSRILSTDLIREYCQEAIYSRDDTGDFIDHLVGVMASRNATSVTRTQLRSEPGMRAAMEDTAFGLSPYNRLVNDGVLVEIPETGQQGVLSVTRHRVEFSFDRALEFLLANQILTQGEVSAATVTRLLFSTQQYPTLLGVAEMLLSLASLQDDGALILGCVDLCPYPLLLNPLVSTLRALQIGGAGAFEQIVDALSTRGALLDGLILLNLVDGMAVENGYEAQNSILELLYNWTGVESAAFRLISGSTLLFAHETRNEVPAAIEIHNELQHLYALYLSRPVNLLPPHGLLSSPQKGRLQAFAYQCRALGAELLQEDLSTEINDSPVDAMLSRLGLNTIVRAQKHMLKGLIDKICGYRAMTTTETADVASDLMFEALQNGRYDTAIRVYDQVGLDLRLLIAQEVPGVIEEVEFELTVLQNMVGPLAALTGDQDALWSNALRLYIADKADLQPYIKDKGPGFLLIIQVLRRCAHAWNQRGDSVRYRECLMRAKEFAEASGVIDPMLTIYGDLAAAEPESATEQKASFYGSLCLALEVYARLSAEQIKILAKADLFDLWRRLAETRAAGFERTDGGVTSSKAMFLRLLSAALIKTLRGAGNGDSEDGWIVAFYGRCRAWLTGDEREYSTELIAAGRVNEATTYLQERVSNYNDLRFQYQFTALVPMMPRLWIFEETSISSADMLSDRLNDEIALLIDLAAPDEATPLSEQGLPTGREGLPTSRGGEWTTILAACRDLWDVASTVQRLVMASTAAVFPGFDPVFQLKEEETFCAALGKTPGTRAATMWVNSLIRCWCSDVEKGAAGDDHWRWAVAQVLGLKSLLLQSPLVALNETASYRFWHEIRRRSTADWLAEIMGATNSVDNLETIILRIQLHLKKVDLSAGMIISELKEELLREHANLLQDFD